MRTWMRLLFVWLVTVALPLQGVAGVTMAHCGASHERMDAAMPGASQAVAGHDHHGVHVHGPDDPSHVHPPAPAPKHDADLAQYKCSSCASCCAGSALPASGPRLPEERAAPAVFVEPRVTVVAFATDGPDRPPRTLPL